MSLLRRDSFLICRELSLAVDFFGNFCCGRGVDGVFTGVGFVVLPLFWPIYDL